MGTINVIILFLLTEVLNVLITTTCTPNNYALDYFMRVVGKETHVSGIGVLGNMIHIFLFLCLNDMYIRGIFMT